MAMVVAKVDNPTDEVIGRGGFVFPPRSEGNEVRTSKVRYAEISAHSGLRITEVSFENDELADVAVVFPGGLNDPLRSTDEQIGEKGFDRGVYTGGGASTNAVMEEGEPPEHKAVLPEAAKTQDETDSGAPIPADYGTQAVKAEDAYDERANNPENEGVPAPSESEESVPEQEGTVDATSEARDLADEEGVNLSNVEGTGADGRVKKSDVQAYLDERDDDNG